MTPKTIGMTLDQKTDPIGAPLVSESTDGGPTADLSSRRIKAVEDGLIAILTGYPAPAH